MKINKGNTPTDPGALRGTDARGGARSPWRTCALVCAAAAAILTTGCMRYLTHDRSEVILRGVDIDQTLDIAEAEFRDGGVGEVLTVWAIRDQYVTPAQAKRISELYFGNVDCLPGRFDTWHLTWAISNLYRQGNADVKAALQSAYDDAKERARENGRLADLFVNGDELYMGDAHSGGRAYAERHVVVPGNEKYVQSFKDYLRRDGGSGPGDGN